MKTTQKTTQNYVNPTSSVTVSGGPNATYNKGNTSYTLNETQQKAYDYAQKSFLEGLKTLNVFSEDTQKELSNQVNAYKQNALSELNTLYSPMLKAVREDSAKRFGNLDNSVFLDNLKSVEENRAKALKSLAQNVTAMKNDLISDELQNRYNYMNFVNSYQNQVLNDALNFSNLANSTANLQNQFTTQKNQNNGTGLNLNDLISVASMVSKFLI